MWKRQIIGKKNQYGQDLPLQIKTDGWEIPTNEEILELIEAVFENEDRIYPRPRFRGCSMFMDEIMKRYVKYLEKNK